MLIVHKLCAIFWNLYWADTREGPDGVRLMEFHLFILYTLAKFKGLLLLIIVLLARLFWWVAYVFWELRNRHKTKLRLSTNRV